MILSQLTNVVDVDNKWLFSLEYNILNLYGNDKYLVISIVFWFLRNYWHHGFAGNWHSETLGSGCVFLL